MASGITTRAEHACFGGTQGYYEHDSTVIGLPMRFAVYQPPQAQQKPVPALFYLAGLTCTEETFMIKAGAQRMAAELGIMLVSCDTSPRDTGIAGEADDWEFGSGAGFYLNATEAPWSQHYRMYDYIVDELRALVTANFPQLPGKTGIFGHSMGGHGALVLGLRNPDKFSSVSAFAPICSPTSCPWGEKALPRYLGEERAAWRDYDACELIRARGATFDSIRIDQGLADAFLPAAQLQPEKFEQACKDVSQPLDYREHVGYDHGYYFISTFMEEHLRFHAQRLTD